METGANGFLATEKVGRLMVKFAVPCVISLLVGALYNIVDQIFIGWGVGYLGNGATSVVFPLTVLALAVAVMIGDGACAYISGRLGAGDGESAGQSVGNAVMLSVLCGVVLMLIYYMYEDKLLHAFGATEANLAYAREYFFYIALGIPFYMFANALNPIIRADGSPRFAMAATLSGAILNVILDPIAIFVLHWGMTGAAVATAAGQVLSAALSLGYLFRMKVIRLSPVCFRPSGRCIGDFLPLGFCSFLSQMSVVIAMAATNNMLVVYGAASKYGSDIALTVLGIVMKIFQIVISVVVGMAAGCIPVVGFNHGAGRDDRALEIMKYLLWAEGLLGLAALVAVEFFPMQLISIFGSESALYNEFAVLTFRIYLSMIVLACINKAAFIFLQSLGRPWLSAGLSLFREVLLGVPLVLLLPRRLGLLGVLYSMPLADGITFAASAAVIILTGRSLKRNALGEHCQSRNSRMSKI